MTKNLIVEFLIHAGRLDITESSRHIPSADRETGYDSNLAVMSLITQGS